MLVTTDHLAGSRHDPVAGAARAAPTAALALMGRTATVIAPRARLGHHHDALPVTPRPHFAHVPSSLGNGRSQRHDGGAFGRFGNGAGIGIYPTGGLSSLGSRRLTNVTCSTPK